MDGEAKPEDIFEIIVVGGTAAQRGIKLNFANPITAAKDPLKISGNDYS